MFSEHPVITSTILCLRTLRILNLSCNKTRFATIKFGFRLKIECCTVKVDINGCYLIASPFKPTKGQATAAADTAYQLAHLTQLRTFPNCLFQLKLEIM